MHSGEGAGSVVPPGSRPRLASNRGRAQRAFARLAFAATTGLAVGCVPNAIGVTGGRSQGDLVGGDLEGADLDTVEEPLHGSCEGSCTEQASDGNCWCDIDCTEHSDCCEDYIEVCTSVTGSCVDSCGEQSRDGDCYCDENCETNGDCCTDYDGLCNTLEIRFLGVGGFSIRYKDDQILPAPHYTNPPIAQLVGGTMAPDKPLINRLLSNEFVAGAKAILVGHAHYDHLLDVPHVWTKTGGTATIYGNRDMKNLLSGLVEDSQICTDVAAGWPAIPNDKLVALNDLSNNMVDNRLCDADILCGPSQAGNPGEWVHVPDSNVRFRALCSKHPPQFYFNFQFAAGCVQQSTCEPPESSTVWREGQTLSYLIDFLDPVTGAPRFRVFYEDAPTDGVVGMVPADILDEKRIDVAILCVGSYNQVPRNPIDALQRLRPRYVIGGHWENFFQTQEQGIEPIVLTNLAEWTRRVNNTLGPEHEAPVVVGNMTSGARSWLPNPGTDFEFAPDVP